MDAAFLKSEHSGQLLTLCIRDDNNVLLLVAAAIVDKESEDGYAYLLRNCMKSPDFAATFDSEDMTIFLDGHTGHRAAIRKVMKKTQVFRCLQHYLRNAPAIGSVSADSCRVWEYSGVHRVCFLGAIARAATVSCPVLGDFSVFSELR